jgi:decaprenylphospho-beta-D-erythro-pentofuranosid-2-ulose 2-reductase
VIDALGNPQSVLLLGGTSEIGLAAIRRFAQGGRLARVVLAGRPGERLDAASREVLALGVDAVTTVTLDAADPSGHAAAIARVFAAGDVDVAVLALGVLAVQDRAAGDAAYAVEIATVNFTGSISIITETANRMRTAGHGALVVMSSVAGERARISNYVYGATKAGLDAFASGLSDSLLGTGVTVTVVRPGFVASKMTSGLKPAPFATTPDVVANAIFDGVRQRKQVVYAPGILRWVATVMRHLPRAIFRKLPG